MTDKQRQRWNYTRRRARQSLLVRGRCTLCGAKLPEQHTHRRCDDCRVSETKRFVEYLKRRKEGGNGLQR